MTLSVSFRKAWNCSCGCGCGFAWWDRFVWRRRWKISLLSTDYGVLSLITNCLLAAGTYSCRGGVWAAAMHKGRSDDGGGGGTTQNFRPEQARGENCMFHWKFLSSNGFPLIYESKLNQCALEIKDVPRNSFLQYTSTKYYPFYSAVAEVWKLPSSSSESSPGCWMRHLSALLKYWWLSILWTGFHWWVIPLMFRFCPISCNMCMLQLLNLSYKFSALQMI